MERITHEEYISAKDVIARYIVQIREDLRDVNKYKTSQSRYFDVKKTDSIFDANVPNKLYRPVLSLVPKDERRFDYTVEDFFNNVTKRELIKTRGIGKVAMTELIDLAINVGMKIKN